MKDALEAGRQKISNQLKAIRFKIRHTKLIKKSLADLTTYTILESCDTDNVSTSPRYNNTCNYEVNYPEVDIKLYQLNNVYCNIEGANFVPESLECAYIEEFPYISCEEANYKAGLIVRHETQYAYIKNIKKHQVKKISAAFFLGGNGALNFYHWMLELVPKLLLLTDEVLQVHDIDTIIVHKCVQQIDNYQWLLEQCSKHLHSIKIVYVDAEDILFVEKLLFMNTFNQTVYNYNSFLDEYRTLSIFKQSNIKALRERLLETVDDNDDYLKNKSAKKIFILRNKNSVSFYNKRDYNEEEIFNYFKQQGFIGIYPEKLSLDAQAKLFQQADFVVGPTGASWSNLIFATKGMKAISWLPSQLKYFDTYCSLASLLGVDMRFLQYKTESEDVHSAYQLDINDVIDLYQQMK